MLKDTLSTGSLDAGRVVVLGGVDDLAILDGNSESASSAIGIRPTDQLAEGAVLIGHEQLSRVSICLRSELGKSRMLTMKSSLTPLALPQPDMT